MAYTTINHIDTAIILLWSTVLVSVAQQVACSSFEPYHCRNGHRISAIANAFYMGSRTTSRTVTIEFDCRVLVKSLLLCSRFHSSGTDPSMLVPVTNIAVLDDTTAFFGIVRNKSRSSVNKTQLQSSS